MDKILNSAERINELMQTEPGDYAVFTPDGISVKTLKTQQAAIELADRMTQHHNRGKYSAAEK